MWDILQSWMLKEWCSDLIFVQFLVTHFGNKNKKAKQYKKVDVNIEFKSKLGKGVMQQVKK